MLDIQIRGPLADLSAAETPISLALFVGRDFDSTQGAFDVLDRLSGGAVRRAVALAGFEGEAEQSLALLAPAPSIERLVLVGCDGDGPDARATSVEAAGAAAARLLGKATEAHFVFEGALDAWAAHAAYGAVLGQYSFDLYRTQAPGGAAPLLAAVVVHVADEQSTEARWTGLGAVARGVVRARDLVSEPPNVLLPAEFARRIETLAELGVDIEVFDTEALGKLGFGALLGVAQGSEAGARMVVMRWAGASASDSAARKPAVFIGKGVTFDSGGISIKPAGGMEEMKTDMAGAAVVVGLMEAVARRGAQAEVIGIVGIAENMLSGRAQRPGDVVRSYSGQTIEVLNTDAEGRLILADVLAYARARFNPAFMVDLATLTGAIVVSLGHARAGLFSNDDALSAALTRIGDSVGEGVWRMPMGKAYDKLLRSDIADMKNIGGRPGGAITAAQFLARFVGDVPWVHLDIAGVAWRSDAGPIGPKGATGFGVRLLDALLRETVEGAAV